MHRVGLRPTSRFEDGVLIQVTLRRSAAADEIGLVPVGDVRRGAIGVRVDGHGPDAELAQRAEDADGDLAAVGDQHLSECGHAVFSMECRFLTS